MTHVSSNLAAWGPSAGRCRDPTGLRWEEAGGWVHGPAPPPEPANRRLSPPPPGDRERTQSWGPGRLANPGRGSSQLGAPGPEIVRFLLLPPPPPPTGPVITAVCRPHALPVGASPRWGCG